MYVGNKRRRGAAAFLLSSSLSASLPSLPGWLSAARLRDGDHHDGLVPFTDDGLSGSRRFAWGKWALSAAAGCCLPSVRGSGGGGSGLPGSPPLPSALPSSSSLPSFQLHTRSPQALIARQPALPLSPAARRTRPLTHSLSRSFVRPLPLLLVVSGSGRAGASYHHQNSVWRCLKNHQWRRRWMTGTGGRTAGLSICPSDCRSY